MFIDDLIISLLMLSSIRFIALLVFLLLFIRHRKIQYFLLFLGWAAYLIGAVPDIVSPNHNRLVLHPFYAFSAALATILLMLSFVSYIRDVKRKAAALTILTVFVILGTILSFYPERLGLASTILQALFLTIIFAAVISNRKTIKNNRSNMSFFWLCITLIVGIFHSVGFTLFLSSSSLSLRLVLTGVVNLSLILFFIYLDWETTQKEYESALVEKEILLQEVHHRVKNNLTIVASMLRLQESTVSDEKRELIMSIENRINTMAIIHELLYRSRKFQDIDLGDYIEELTDSIELSFSSRLKPIAMIREILPVRLNLNILVPTGMLINEIVTNAYKHAFEDIESPEIRIKVETDGNGTLILSIADNGCGLREPEVRDSDSTGFVIIDALKEQLNALLKIDNNNGTEYIIKIPDVLNTNQENKKNKR